MPKNDLTPETSFGGGKSLIAASFFESGIIPADETINPAKFNSVAMRSFGLDIAIPEVLQRFNTFRILSFRIDKVGAQIKISSTILATPGSPATASSERWHQQSFVLLRPIGPLA